MPSFEMPRTGGADEIKYLSHLQPNPSFEAALAVQDVGLEEFDPENIPRGVEVDHEASVAERCLAALALVTTVG